MNENNDKAMNDTATDDLYRYLQDMDLNEWSEFFSSIDDKDE